MASFAHSHNIIADCSAFKLKNFLVWMVGRQSLDPFKLLWLPIVMQILKNNYYTSIIFMVVVMFFLTLHYLIKMLSENNHRFEWLNYLSDRSLNTVSELKQNKDCFDQNGQESSQRPKFEREKTICKLKRWPRNAIIKFSRRKQTI